ncbi:bifunctional glycosyltransferase/CDP-glycerol:glycerophosphate glycerophosphotransferase [Brevibacterium aurantiacum]|uniref:bifunctional glycosyltransferase/CDP-glycerol:glycerophosphate glycerophosphotransferase n=1 Tax=Brevibacterium aurantiacum TaxID=273384 RepID=UPI0018660D15|nr:CDP-glycerol glycerophosphotransferase family protein [Brevibacterium aurantiacum]
MNRIESLARSAYRKSRSVAVRARQSTAAIAQRLEISGQEARKAADVVGTRRIVRKASEPQLAVIVPAYNVDDYLEECVLSIIAQTYTNWEMFIIDDGSPGRTGEIADSLAEADPRITVVHQQNQGLGAARNTGIRVSSAPYLTFVDSDDVIPSEAFSHMMNSLEASGSDVAIGSMERFNSTRRWTPFWVDLVHSEERISITATEHPPIMWDVFACNKVFKRSSWNESVREFPVGTLYEDQECTAKLFVSGAKFDVLTEVVYHWRLREDGLSITQNKAETRDLQQRLTVAETVRQVIETAPQPFIDYWYTKCLGEDFFYYYREVPRADEEFFDILQSGVRRFYDFASEQAIRDIAPERRWLAYLAAYETRDQITQLLVAFDSYRTYYSAISDGERLVGGVPGLKTLFEGIPDHLKTVDPQHLAPQALISSIRSALDGSLIVDLFAYVPNLAETISCAARIESPAGDVIRATGSRAIPGAVGHLTADPYHEHQQSKFEVTFSAVALDEVLTELAATESEYFDIVLSIQYAGHTWEIRNPKRLADGAAAWPKPGETTVGGNRFVVVGDPGISTALRFLKPRFRVQVLSLIADELYVEAELQVGNGLPRHELFELSDAQLRLRSGQSVIEAVNVENDGTTARARISVAHLRGPAKKKLSESLMLDILCNEKFSAPLAVDESLLHQTKSMDRVGPSSSSYGYLQLEIRRISAEVTDVRVDPDGEDFVISGRFYSDPSRLRTHAPSLTLVGSTRSIPAAKTTWNSRDHSFEAAFNMGESSGELNGLPVAGGDFILQALLPSGQPAPATLWVPVENALQADLPRDLTTSVHNFRLACTGRSRTLKVMVTGAGNTMSSNSAFTARRSALALFAHGDRKIESGTMFFESFGGNTVSGSPKEIDRAVASLHPEIQRIWSVRDHSVPVPEGARAVVVGSEAWMRCLSTSEVLVNNNNFPHYFRKTTGQKYIQTWHGTPLKRIGNHVPGANLSLRYRSLMQKEAEHEWDLLLAQSPWAAEQLSDAFGFSGKVFAKGYPRNDSLNDPGRIKDAQKQVRAAYGIREEQTVVLYAPTWRDNLKDATGRYSRVDFLGLRSAASSLGDKYVILYRGHANSVFSEQGRLPSGVLDVSFHDDVNDLISASDMLLTDYSSIMFDFAVTGKPIAFIAPDLNQYRDETRGFYFDFETMAPGPIFQDGASAVQWISGETRTDHEYSERYARFVDKFAPFDDGRAIDRLLAEYGETVVPSKHAEAGEQEA